MIFELVVDTKAPDYQKGIYRLKVSMERYT